MVYWGDTILQLYVQLTVHAYLMLYDIIGMCLCISCLPNIWFFNFIGVVFVHYKSNENLLFCVLYRL